MMNLEGIARQFFEFETGSFEAEPIGSGNINDTFRIAFLQKNEPQVFILQRLNHLVFTKPDDVMSNARLLAERLAASDFSLKIPTPQPTIRGDFWANDAAGNWWRVLPFFEKTFAPDQADSPEIAYEAARGIGLFLKKLADLPAENLKETIAGFHDTARRWLVFEAVLKENKANRLQFCEKEVAEIFNQKHVFEKIDSLKKSGELPSRATHNDPKAANVLLDISTKKAVAVIDWDTAMAGTIPSDFGDMMRSFAPTLFEDDPAVEKMEVNLPIVEAMCAGFLDEAAPFLTTVERENLFAGGQWIIFEQALRFLTDFLAGDVYYKTAFPEHNLVRARNQLALLRAVGRHEAAIRRFLK